MLDTNICIYLLKRYPPEVARRFRSLREGQVVMSAVTYAELRAGLEMHSGHAGPLAQRAHDEQVLRLLAQRIPALAFDDMAAERFGILRAAVRDRRRDALDRLIAAHAVSLGATLVTNNEADFADYPGLQIENWVRAD